MPPIGKYLLANVGFNKNKPSISLSDQQVFSELNPLGKTLTMRVDTTQRYCTGWRDITAGKRYTCPDDQLVEPKYEQCSACQKKTGFNPAFYHATSISPQQEARNQEPHILYLAYFGADIVKVGISHAARGHARLLEQGARHAIILDTFATANIARQYEAKVAAVVGVAETVAVRQKIAALSGSYDKTRLSSMLLKIEASVGTKFTSSDLLSFDDAYFPDQTPKLDEAFDASALALISGDAVGMIGSVLCCLQQETPILLPLKRFVGYMIDLSYTETAIELPARQTSLF